MRKDVLPLRRQRRQRLDGLAHLVGDGRKPGRAGGRR
jgi:hypothetical protein